MCVRIDELSRDTRKRDSIVELIIKKNETIDELRKQIKELDQLKKDVRDLYYMVLKYTDVNTNKENMFLIRIEKMIKEVV